MVELIPGLETRNGAVNTFFFFFLFFFEPGKALFLIFFKIINTLLLLELNCFFQSSSFVGVFFS
jgi:hypothetical protein